MSLKFSVSSHFLFPSKEQPLGQHAGVFFSGLTLGIVGRRIAGELQDLGTVLYPRGIFSMPGILAIRKYVRDLVGLCTVDVPRFVTQRTIGKILAFVDCTLIPWYCRKSLVITPCTCGHTKSLSCCRIRNSQYRGFFDFHNLATPPAQSPKSVELLANYVIRLSSFTLTVRIIFAVFSLGLKNAQRQSYPLGFEWRIDCESIEHREKYSMGKGYYLATDAYSGWRIQKCNFSRYMHEEVFLALDTVEQERLARMQQARMMQIAAPVQVHAAPASVPTPATPEITDCEGCFIAIANGQ